MTVYCIDGDLDVSMHDIPSVQVLQCAKQLQHDALHLRLAERHAHVIQQAGQVLLAVLHDEEHRVGRPADDHFVQLHDVLVAHLEQYGDLAVAAHADALRARVEAHLLQRHDAIGVGAITRAVHDAVGALTQSVQLLEVGHRATRARREILR